METADVAWDKLFDVLVRAEGIGEQDAGTFTFPDPAGGGVFVEGGRICWAAASGTQQRLRDLLVELTRTHGVDLDGVYERCRASGVPFGETMVSSGLVSANELERVLRRHSAESLIALCHDDAQRPLWTSRGGRGYSARFTFRPLDVFLDVVGMYVPDLQQTAHAALAPLAPAGQRGAAFTLTESYDIAVPVAAFGESSVQWLQTLGRWAMAIPNATLELGATPAFTLAVTASGDTAVVWWRGTLLYVVACRDRTAVASLAHQLANAP